MGGTMNEATGEHVRKLCRGDRLNHELTANALSRLHLKYMQCDYNQYVNECFNALLTSTCY
jgi:hypothetical protein